MPIPLMVYAIGEIAITAGVWAWRGYQAYEAAQAVLEAAEMAKAIAESKKEIEKKFKEIIGSIAKEIDTKSSTFALVDTGGKSTVSRRGTENTEWKEYIERKLPFRPAISAVCQLALATPIKVPRRIRNKISGDLVEDTIELKLKQTTASIVFETIDSLLEWKSPIKAEPNYNKSTQAAYLGTPATRPKRISDIFPFWPRPRGSLAPDIVIVEYRQKSFEIDNVYAAVEIKFPDDWVKQNQMDNYVLLMEPKSGLDRKRIGKERVALLRVPEDCVALASKDQPAKNRGKKARGSGGRI